MRYMKPWLVAVLLTSAGVAQAGTKIDVDKPMKPGGTIAVQNLAGDVEITGWDKSSLHIGGSLGSEQQQLKVTGSGNQMKIKVIYPPKGHDNDGAHLKIQVPKSSGVVASTVSADVRTTGLAGKQQVQSVSGDVVLDSADAPINAQSVSGEVTLKAGHDLPRHVSLQTTSGRVLLAGRPASDGAYRLNAVSGDIQIAVPKNAKAAYDLRTISGDIDNGFGPEPSSSEYSASTELTFGKDKNAHIIARSVSGDIELSASAED